MLYFVFIRSRDKMHYRRITVQWNLCNPTPEFSDILLHMTKIYGRKVFLLTKIKPECSDILYNRTHFLVPVVCWIGQVPLCIFFYWTNQQKCPRCVLFLDLKEILFMIYFFKLNVSIL